MERARQLLVASVAAYPANWGAWQVLMSDSSRSGVQPHCHELVALGWDKASDDENAKA
jgi:hypothetical protein